MRYAIPKDKKLQQQEKINILRAAGEEWNAVNEALQFIMNCSGDNYVSRQSDYGKLWKIYVELGIAGRKPETVLFPVDQRNDEYFREELEKLWRVLELHTLEKGESVASTYLGYEEDPEAGNDRLRESEEQEAGKEAEEPLPLVDQDSPYYHFVAGTVYEELLKLWKGIKEQLPQEEIHVQMLNQDMDQLLSRMQLQYLRRNEMASMLPMTKQAYTELRDLYQECLKDMTHCSAQERALEGYQELRALMQQNEQSLLGLPEDDLPPLAKVIHGLSAPELELRNANKTVLSGAISQREAVEYIDESGELRHGIFTPENAKHDKMSDVKEILDKVIKQYPKYAKFFRYLKKSSGGEYRAYNELENAMRRDLENPRNGALLRYLRRTDRVPSEYRYDMAFEQVFYDVVGELSVNMQIHGVQSDSGLETGDELTRRSGAMTDVARALGFPEMLANSRMVTVKRDGKEVKGVMMEAADLDTVDPKSFNVNAGMDHPFFHVDLREFDSQPVLSSLADLQILDYLCGNTDRHRGNFFFRMDASDPQHPKLVGVQGIDNDNSFGNIADGGILRLADADNLKIITPKMAEAVTAMTEEKLRRVLEPYQLSESQLTAAGQRLMTLQNMVREGKKQIGMRLRRGKLINAKGSIHIVQDGEWKQLNQDALMPKPVKTGKTDKNGKSVYKKSENIFEQADTYRSEVILRNKIKAADAEYPDKKPISFVKHGMETMDYDLMQERMQNELGALNRFERRFKDEHGDYDNRSRQFKDMRGALSDYRRAYRQLKNAFSDPENEVIGEAKEKPKSREERLKDAFQSLNDARRTLYNRINQYLNKSHHWFKSDRNKKRIAIAEELKAVIREQPESLRLFQSSRKLQKHFTETMAKKDDFQLANYVTEQIHGRMKLTLSGNLSRLHEDDPVRVQGIRAFNAQNRLWNYGQSGANKGTIDVQGKTTDEKKRVSLEKLQAELRKNASGPVEAEKIRTDLQEIRNYADALEKRSNKQLQQCRQQDPDGTTEAYRKAKDIRDHSAGLKQQIDQLLERKDITPANVRGVLGTLFVGENKIAAGTAKKKVKAFSRS